MCGIFIAIGENAYLHVVKGLEKLTHRGKDSRKIHQVSEEIVFGFNRLAINDLSAKGDQPFVYENWIWVCNGEFYNYQLIKQELEFTFYSNSDSECLLPVFLKYGENSCEYLDGMYAAVMYDKATGQFYTFRDYLGIKTVFIIKTESNIFFTSELKAVTDKIISIQQIPCGFTIYDKNGNLIQNKKEKLEPPKFYPLNKYETLRELLRSSVQKRIPSLAIKLGVLLSGGIDSSIIGMLASQYRKDIYFITVGLRDSEDIHYAKILTKHLDLQNNHFVFEYEESELLQFLENVIYHLEKFNPSNVTNGLMTYLATQHAAELGIKVLLCGEGADELFCGYRSFLETSNWYEDRNILLQNMKETELLRLDRMSMAWTVEAREPFLDKEIYKFAYSLDRKDCLPDDKNTLLTKTILREIFKNDLPAEVLNRPKVPFDVGTQGRRLMNYIPVEIAESDMFCEYDGNPSLEMKYYYYVWKKLFPNLINMKTNFHDFGDYPLFMKFIEKRKTTQ